MRECCRLTPGSGILDCVGGEVTRRNQGRRRRVHDVDLEFRRACITAPVGSRAGHRGRAEGECGVSCRCTGDQPRLVPDRPPSARTKSTIEPAKPFASTVLSAGTLLRTGGVVSTTVTLNVLLALLVCESVALQVTVVCPIAKVVPEAGVQLEVETASSGSAALNE